MSLRGKVEFSSHGQVIPNFRRATCAAEEGLIRRRRKLLFNLLADLRLLGMFTALGLLRWTFVLGLPGSTGFLRGKGGGGSAALRHYLNPSGGPRTKRTSKVAKGGIETKVASKVAKGGPTDLLF